MGLRTLYAVVLLATAGALTLEAWTSSRLAHAVIDLGDVAVTFGVMALWVHANRRALSGEPRPPSDEVRWEERA